MTESTVRIAVVFPDLLGTYGDRGNATVLMQRLGWHGYPSEIVEIPAGHAVPASCDLYLLGGGEDIAQDEAVRQLDNGGFAAALDRGATVLAVCAGLQMLGISRIDEDGTSHPGLGLLDMTSHPGPHRAIGEINAHANPALRLPDPVLTGFENHRGHTRLGPGIQPLATVVAGTGNGDGTDGVIAGPIVGTYLHGPVLARNPALADHLLARTTGESGPPIDLPDLPALRRAALGRAARQHSRWRRVRTLLTPRRWMTPGTRP